MKLQMRNLLIVIMTLMIVAGCRMADGQNEKSLYSEGELVVIFEKDISETTAKKILGKYGLSYTKYGINLGKSFYYSHQDNAVFLVSIPAGEENAWKKILLKENQNKKILGVRRNYDYKKIMID